MVQRIQRDEINSLPDALTTESFTLLFGSIPGESDTRRLTLQCQSVQEPEETNETITNMLAGIQKYKPRHLYCYFLRNSRYGGPF